MTKEQVREEMDRILPEFFDGYILIARVAGTSTFVINQRINDLPTKSGIVLTMANAMDELAGPILKRN